MSKFGDLQFARTCKYDSINRVIKVHGTSPGRKPLRKTLTNTLQLRSRGKSKEGLNGILLKLFPILLLHEKMIVRTLIISIEIQRFMRSLKLNLRKERVLEQGKKK